MALLLGARVCIGPNQPRRNIYLLAILKYLEIIHSLDKYYSYICQSSIDSLAIDIYWVCALKSGCSEDAKECDLRDGN